MPPGLLGKLISVLANPTSVLGIKVIQNKSVIWLFFKINLSTTISMKRSRRELSIDILIHRGIFKNNQITLFLGIILPKTGASFSCVVRK